MQQIDIARGLIFKEIDANIEKFDKRLITQKKMYLLKCLDINVGFHFNWYIHGPYSPELTSYMYENLDILKEYNYAEYSLSNLVKENINKINELSEEKNNLCEADWYELLASILYLYKQSNNLGDDLYNLLIKHKPQFTKTEFDQAIDALKSVSLINNKTESSK